MSSFAIRWKTMNKVYSNWSRAPSAKYSFRSTNLTQSSKHNHSLNTSKTSCRVSKRKRSKYTNSWAATSNSKPAVCCRPDAYSRTCYSWTNVLTKLENWLIKNSTLLLKSKTILTVRRGFVHWLLFLQLERLKWKSNWCWIIS